MVECKAELMQTQIKNLKNWQKFSFVELPERTHTVFANYGYRVVYKRQDDWLISTEDLERIVNLIE